jgi:hypothetical protein
MQQNGSDLEEIIISVITINYGNLLRQSLSISPTDCAKTSRSDPTAGIWGRKYRLRFLASQHAGADCSTDPENLMAG